MIDLTRARYLGLAHAHDSLARWSELTSGRPAALGDVPAIGVLARWLARLLGFPAVTLAPSTLHVVTDLYAALPVRHVYVDACAYEVTRWGLERARIRGVSVHTFRTPRELAQIDGGAIVCDAICVACGRVAPLAALQAIAERTRSWLIVDDSQGVGLLGARPSRAMPYGCGGGGTVRWSAARCERVIVLGSLAKAFGAPIAFVAGSEPMIQWYARTSGTRVHSSPCNAASLAALDSALRANAECGDALRASLLERIHVLRHAVARAGVTLAGGVFPVQMTAPLASARMFDAELHRRGVRGVRLRHGRLAFIVNADHDLDELADAGAIIGGVLSSRRPRIDRGARLVAAESHAP